eukprot:gnl/Spiro4/16564_TR8916_c0_g1_i1.p1 gnl/Spiro4/16564_TR8916_c0_g1~~gnl/Spiro4/16564_TR8916_c0_g1_i1.p1  ORF type:complete len:393 (+),score=144.74 gnl/Spiro4/16564_TR8916_c0_g1_i1:96-1181(+)
MAEHIKNTAFFKSVGGKVRPASAKTGGGTGTRPSTAVSSPRATSAGRSRVQKKTKAPMSRLDWDPKHHDGPQLKEEIRQLRLETSRLEQEVAFYEAKSRRLDEVLASKNSQIETMLGAKAELDVGTGTFDRVRSEETFLNKLKQQVRALEIQVHEKNDSILNLSRQPKYTRSVQLEIEVKTYQDEVARLKRLIEEHLKGAGDTPRTRGLTQLAAQRKRKEDLIDQERRLRLQKDRLASTIEHVVQENNELRDEIAEMEDRLRDAVFNEHATSALRACVADADFDFDAFLSEQDDETDHKRQHRSKQSGAAHQQSQSQPDAQPQPDADSEHAAGAVAAPEVPPEGHDDNNDEDDDLDLDEFP